MKKISLSLMFLFSLSLFAEIIPVINSTPYHEAFIAEVKDLTPELVVKKSPPAPLSDQIPKQNDPRTIWIPGYWSYLAEKNEYTWVSGIWRLPPPGMQWNSGSWKNVDGGWLFVKGFWSNAPASTMKFIATAPPSPLEEVPASPLLTHEAWNDYYFIKGNYSYDEQTSSYKWLKGSWEIFDKGWILTPAHYQWRPDGYVFIPAYWDYPLEMRGSVSSLKNPDSSEILSPLLIQYPSYSYLYSYYFHFYPNLWSDCPCTPPWWNTKSFWNLTWNSESALWWWYIHDGEGFTPSFITKEFSESVMPLPSILKDPASKLPTPLYVTPRGIPQQDVWLDVIQQVTNRKEKTPNLPLNVNLKKQIVEIAENTLTTNYPPLKPSGKGIAKVEDLQFTKNLSQETVLAIEIPAKPSFVKPLKKAREVPVASQEKISEAPSTITKEISNEPVADFPQEEPVIYKPLSKLPATARRGGVNAPPVQVIVVQPDFSAPKPLLPPSKPVLKATPIAAPLMARPYVPEAPQRTFGWSSKPRIKNYAAGKKVKTKSATVPQNYSEVEVAEADKPPYTPPTLRRVR